MGSFSSVVCFRVGQGSVPTTEAGGPNRSKGPKAQVNRKLQPNVNFPSSIHKMVGMGERLGLRTMAAFIALILLGLALVVGGMFGDSGAARGAGLLSIFCGAVGAVFLGIRWIIYRGIG